MAILNPRRIGHPCLARRRCASAARLTRAVCAGCLAIGLGLGLAAAPSASAAERVAGEYEIKAAFLYNFARYVEWPQDAVPNADGAFVIGILGEDPFGNTLDRIARDKTVEGKRIVVRRFATVQEVTPCHILFVASSAARQLPALLKRVEGWHVLLIGDTQGLAQEGVAINFCIEKSKVRFEINLDAAVRMGLKISSKLLRLAKIVTDKNEA
jgi:hypothetical protein